MVYMAIGISEINDLNSLFLLDQTISGISQPNFDPFLNGIGSTGGLTSLLDLFSLFEAEQIFMNSLADSQALNRSELALRNAVEPLNTQNANSVFSTNTTTSSNPTAVGATALTGAEPGAFEIGVNQLATGQNVTGGPVTAAAPTGITTANGIGQLEFTFNGTSPDVTFQLNGTETNQQALNTIATAINNAGIGVTANTVLNATTGNVTLNLVGTAGAANAFTVTDELGNAAAFTGIGNPANVTQVAQNAQFTVNGVPFESPNNQPTLDTTGLQLNLLLPTGNVPATVTIGPNNAAVESAIQNFVSTFNQTITNLLANESPFAQGTATTLLGVVAGATAGLENIGITTNTNGLLTINETTFQNALANQPGDIFAAFNGAGAFAAGVQSATEDLINSVFSSLTPFEVPSIFSNNTTFDNNLSSLVALESGLFFNTFA